jgi:hypothetical protein
MESTYEYDGLPRAVPAAPGGYDTSPRNKKLHEAFQFAKQYGVAPFEEAATVDLDKPELKQALKSYKRPKDSARGRLKKMMKEYAVEKQLQLTERGNRFFLYGRGDE